MKQFGKSPNKYIPKEIKNLCPRQLKILLDAMCLGDGHTRYRIDARYNIPSKETRYYTASEQLADDVQEILLKIGISGNIVVVRDKDKDYDTKIKGRKITPNYDELAVSFVFKNEPLVNYNKQNKNKAHHEWVDYVGMVYCLEVPNHIIYVRRNGKPCWSGNSVARNEMVREFLESDATHLLSWDVDQVFYVDTMLRLLNANKPVVSSFYLARNPEKVGTIVVFKRSDTENLCDYTHFNTYKPYSPKELFSLPRVENDGMEPLVQVDGVGMGCILFQREVFDNLRKPYFLEWSPVMPSDVHKFGEDIWFGDVLAEAGIPIYVNLACFVGHEVTTVLDDNYLKRQLIEVGTKFA